MAHIEDRWYKVVRGPGRSSQRVKSERFGKGNRYRVRYVAPDGKERSRSFPDRAKRSAEAFLVTVEADKLRGTYVDPAGGRVSFRAYAEQWLASRTFDASTRETTSYRVHKHLMPFFGHRSLASIKPGHVREWDRSLTTTLAASTRSVVFAHLRSIFTAAVDDELLAKNPCSARSVKQPRVVEGRVVPWTLEQVMAVRAALVRRYQPMADMAWGCGLRQGEVFGLGVDDFDFDDGWVEVRRQVKKIRGRLVFGLPKSDRSRRVPLPVSIGKEVQAHLVDFAPIEITLPWEDPEAGELVTVRLVFTTPRRSAINRSSFDHNNWQKALKAAGLPSSRSTGMHALRHFYASSLLDAGESIKALSEYLGHADPGFTLRVYTHLMPASEDRTRRAIDALMFGPDGPKQVTHRTEADHGSTVS